MGPSLQKKMARDPLERCRYFLVDVRDAERDEMNLYRKTLLGILSTIVVLGGTLISLTWIGMLRSYDEFETLDTHHHLESVRSALDGRIENINGHLNDWAAWDHTYRYMATRDPAYLVDNFAGPVTFRDLGLHLVAYITPAGELVYANAIDPGPGAPHFVPFPKSLMHHLKPTSPLVSHLSTTSRVVGILLLDEGPLMVASQPVVKGSHEGPILGALVWGRFLMAEEIEEIIKTTHVSVTIQRVDDPALMTDMKDASAAMIHGAGSGSSVVRNLDEDQVAGYALLNDIYARPALVLRVDTPRTLHRQGQVNSKRLALILGLVCMVFALVASIMLRRIILTRLRDLSSAVLRIGASGDLAARVPAAGNDELATLAGSINDMMEQIERSQSALRDGEALRLSEEHYRSLVESSPIAVLIVRDGLVVFANSPAARLIGAQSSQEVEGQTIHRFLAIELPEHGGGFYPVFHREMKLCQLAGTRIDVELIIGPHQLQGAAAVQLVIQDVSARKQAEQQLNYLAYHDLLTGLPNRLLFMRKLDQMLMRARKGREQILVMILDLDRFKDVNDQAGYVVGDRVIIEIADRLRDAVRTTDLIARSGEDEFFLVCQLSGEPDLPQMLPQRILDLFCAPFQSDDHVFQVTSSIGLAVFPADGNSVETLTHNAETVMYRAKAAGGNCFVRFESELGDATNTRRVMRRSLRYALTGHELELYYQPRLDMKMTRVVGVETQVRWHHPTLGLVSPTEFIPIAEETGLIVPITEWMLGTALEHARHWRDLGMPQLQVTVRLSANHVRTRHRPSIVEYVRILLETLRIAPCLIELELTESMAMQDLESTMEVMAQLHSMGIALAIHGFGSGHSSLAYLQRFPIHRLKIARSFVQDVDTKPGNQAVIEAILAMAHAFDLEVVAEGVETERELQILLDRGCDMLQGTLVSAPMPVAGFARWYQTWVDDHRSDGERREGVGERTLERPVLFTPNSGTFAQTEQLVQMMRDH